MSESISITDFHFLLFIIPGFIAVWTWRYSTYSKKQGDFELLGLSFFWGIVIAALYAATTKDKNGAELLIKNPYAACVVLSTIGSLFAFSLSTGKENSRATKIQGAIKYLFLKITKKIFKKRK